jgi:hypothetical protein
MELSEDCIKRLTISDRQLRCFQMKFAVVEHLPSIRSALGLMPSTTKQTNNNDNKPKSFFLRKADDLIVGVMFRQMVAI